MLVCVPNPRAPFLICPTQANATKDSYRFSDLVTFCRVRLKEGGALLKIHFVEFAGQ